MLIDLINAITMTINAFLPILGLAIMVILPIHLLIWLFKQGE